MTSIQIHKSDVTPQMWETLCEIALGYPIDSNVYEQLDVVSIDYNSIVPAIPQTTVYEDGSFGTMWNESTKEEFRNLFQY